MTTTTQDQASIDLAFAELVFDIEELEDLQAPGWGFWEGFAVGTVFAGAIVGGIALT
ncbi:daptide-type RiPP [Frankia sp. Cppng1_Ct_nod]|uniref:daptide-type RiPP n=1 Tax=Frankia sp. Cppng1_Ct_nod TaxID=2897162 RepID=UPI0013EF9C21|nr:daptide-type RiPP [Frankia sp. Cppng1_Ct_nod]